MKEHVLDLGHILKNSTALQASNNLSSTSSFAGSPGFLNSRAVNSDKVYPHPYSALYSYSSN
jgi:hypothetical protein